MEEWKENPLYPEYLISNLGNVARKKDGLVLKQYPQKSGYVSVILNRGYGKVYVPVHRLVATTFLGLKGNEKGLYVDHINTIRSDNRVENLRWVTPKENANNENTKKNRQRNKVKMEGKTKVITVSVCLATSRQMTLRVKENCTNQEIKEEIMKRMQIFSPDSKWDIHDFEVIEE